MAPDAYAPSERPAGQTGSSAVPTNPEAGGERIAELWGQVTAARSPEDLQRIESEARAIVTSDPEGPEAEQAGAMAESLSQAREALTQVAGWSEGLSGTPTERLEALVGTQANLTEVAQARQALGILEGSPLARSAQGQLNDLATEATPEQLASAMEGVEVASLPMGVQEDLVKLAGQAEGPVAEAMDGLAEQLMGAEGFPDVGLLEDNPLAAALVQRVASGPDGDLKSQLRTSLDRYADARIEARGEGKNNDSVDEMMEAYADDMKALARATGLGELVSEVATEGTERQRDFIEEVANRDKGILDRIGDFFGGIGDFLGDVAGAALDFAGDVVEFGANVAGTVVEAGLDATGTLAGAVVAFQGHTLATVADAVGADGLAEDLHQGADAAGDAVNRTVDGLGETAGDTVRGAGSAVNGALDVAALIAEKGPEGAAEEIANRLIGPEIPQYAGQLDGLVGLVANRLDKGDSAFLEVGASAGVGAVLGVEGSVSGAVQISRDEQGQILLSFDVEGKVTGSVSAETGAGATAQTPLGEVGAEATAEAGVSASATGRAKVTMRFDPNNAGDAVRLEGLLNPTWGDAAAAALTGNPLAAAALHADDLAEAMQHNHFRTEVGGEVGAGANASASATAPGLEATVGAEAHAAVGRNFATYADGRTEDTVYFSAGASVGGGITGPGDTGFGLGKGVDISQSFTVAYGADDQVEGLSMVSSNPPETEEGPSAETPQAQDPANPEGAEGTEGEEGADGAGGTEGADGAEGGGDTASGDGDAGGSDGAEAGDGPSGTEREGSQGSDRAGEGPEGSDAPGGADGPDAADGADGPEGTEGRRGGTERDSAEATQGDGEPGGPQASVGLEQSETVSYRTELTDQGMAAATTLMAQGQSAKDAFDAVYRLPGNSTTVEIHRTTDAITFGVEGEVKVAGVGLSVGGHVSAGVTRTESDAYQDPSILTDQQDRPRN